MMYLNLIAVAVLFIAFMLIVMNIIEGKIRTKANERLIWKASQMDNRDRVVTMTGGLSHDRINERIYERNPDTGKIRSRKSGDYDNLVDEDCRMDEMEKRK